MTRQGKHHTVRSDLTGLTLLIITTKQSVTFYGKMYGKVQYRTPIPSHVPVKVNTVTCAGKGFVTPNKHDELPHSFYSAVLRIIIIINNAVFHQKSNKYDVVSLPVPLVGQKTCPPREILTWLFITENAL